MFNCDANSALEMTNALVLMIILLPKSDETMVFITPHDAPGVLSLRSEIGRNGAIQGYSDAWFTPAGGHDDGS